MRKAFSRKNLWENAPPVVRTLAGGLLGFLPPGWLLGERFRKSLALIDEAEFWDADQIRQWQLGQLQRVIGLAYHRSPFYKRTLSAIGFEPGDLQTLSDMRRLPLIDKSAIREEGERIRTISPGAQGVDYVTTGGTGGEPLRFWINADRSGAEFAHLFAGWRRFGYTLRTPQAVLRGKVTRVERSGLHHDYDPILRRHSYSCFHMGDVELNDYLTHIATLGNCYLHVYPSTLTALCRFLRRTGVEPPGNIRGILAGSEIVYPEDRALAEELLGVRYASWYGHSEKLVLASECEDNSNYHVWPTYGYCELVDESGVVITEPGVRGEIVGTGFINTVMPFIRYRTGDFATLVGDWCDGCGRPHMLLREIRGHRTQEMLVATDGSTIPWTALNMHDDTFDRVRRFQFRQETPGQAQLWVVPGAGFGDADRKRIRQNLDKKLDGRIAFDVRETEDLQQTHRGKAIYVDQRIDLDELRRQGVEGVNAA